MQRTLRVSKESRVRRMISKRQIETICCNCFRFSPWLRYNSVNQSETVWFSRECSKTYDTETIRSDSIVVKIDFLLKNSSERAISFSSCVAEALCASFSFSFPF